MFQKKFGFFPINQKNLKLKSYFPSCSLNPVEKNIKSSSIIIKINLI